MGCWAGPKGLSRSRPVLPTEHTQAASCILCLLFGDSIPLHLVRPSPQTQATEELLGLMAGSLHWRALSTTSSDSSTTLLPRLRSCTWSPGVVPVGVALLVGLLLVLSVLDLEGACVLSSVSPTVSLLLLCYCEAHSVKVSHFPRIPVISLHSYFPSVPHHTGC